MGASDRDSGESELQKHRERGFLPFTKRVATVLAMVSITVVVMLLIWEMVTLLLVLLLSVLFAIFLRGLTNFAIRHTPLGEPVALFVVLFVLILVLGGVGWLMAPPISAQSEEIRTTIPKALAELQLWLESTNLGRRILDEAQRFDVESLLSGEAIGRVGGAFFGTMGVLSYIGFVVVVGIYLAFRPRTYIRGILRLIPMGYRGRMEEIIAVCAHQLSWWLIGRLVSMLAIAVLTGVGLWILGIPLPFILGVMAGLFSFVPILGSFVAFVPAALMALLVAPQYVVWTGLIFMGAQFLESNFVEPIVQQSFVSLPHAATLVAEVLAALLFGLAGIIVATPLAVLSMALINMIYVEDVLGDTTPFREIAERYR